MIPDDYDERNGVDLESSTIYPKLSIIERASLFFRGMRIPATILGSLAVIGTFTFSYLEDWDYLTSLYFTVVTLTTVGYGDVSPKTDTGRFVVMGLIVGGIATFAFATRNAIEYVLEMREPEFIEPLIIQKLRNHVIFVGSNRSFINCARLLELVGIASVFVVSEEASDTAEFLSLEESKLTHEDVLERVGVKRSQGIIVDARGNDHFVVDLLALYETLESLKIVVIGDDPETAMLLDASTPSEIAFLHEQTRLGLQVKNELLGIHHFGAFVNSQLVPEELKITEIPVESSDLQREAGTLELNELVVLGFITHSSNYFLPRKRWKKKKLRSLQSVDGLMTGNLLVIGPQTRIAEIDGQIATIHGKRYNNGLLLADGPSEALMEMVLPAVRQTCHNVIVHVSATDPLKKKSSKTLQWRTGGFLSAVKREELKEFDLVIILLENATKALGRLMHLRKANTTAKTLCRISSAKDQSLFIRSGADFLFSPEDTLAGAIAGQFSRIHPYSNAIILSPQLKIGWFGMRISKVIRQFPRSDIACLWESLGTKIATRHSRRKRLTRKEGLLLSIPRTEKGY